MARTRGTGKGRMRWLGLGLAAATRAVLWLARAAATAIGSLVARNRTRREAQDPAGRERARLAALLSGMRRRAEEATREATQRAEELASARKALLHIVRDLESARAAAEAANNAKSQFLANMSHEIRTPMNAILGFAKLLLREPLSDGQRSCVETICRSGNHLMALINDILDLSKIEADRVELHLEVVDVGLAARGVCELLGPRAAEKGLALAVEVHPSTPAGATTDPGCLRQILMNLVGNALKFTDHGSVTVRVGPPAPAPPSCPLPLGEGRVRAPGATQPPLSGALSPALSQGERGQCLLPAEEGERREMIHFAVADTGIGIPADKLDAVFEAFVQADGSISRKYGGTGLGLAISKRLVGLLGGRIWVESAPGRGSTFHFTIKNHLAPRPQREAPAQPSEVRNPKPEIRNLPDDALVLVVEDDPTTAHLTSALLRKAGYHPVVARDGAAAIELARRQPPLAILLDLVLPVMDGFQVLKALKADPALACVPVIVCSVLPDRRKAYSLGALDYIEKPMDGDLLVRKLERLRHRFAAGGNVLVVDDERATLRIIERALTRAGYRAATAASGAECLAMLDARQPVDLVVLDLVMPDVDGFEVLDALRQREATRRVPVIVNTARDLSPADLARLNGRYDAILRKSAADIPDMVSRVAELLDAARATATSAGPETGLTQSQQREERRPGPLKQSEIRNQKSEMVPEPPSRPATILVAEDRPATQALLRSVLEREGHRMLLAEDGLSAVEAVQREPVDLVLMDVQMPNLDGLEATRRIRRDARGPEPPHPGTHRARHGRRPGEVPPSRLHRLRHQAG